MPKFFSKKSFIELKYSLSDTIKEQKWRFIIACLLVFVCLFLGIMVAIRFYAQGEIELLEDYSLVDISSGLFASTFFSRLISILVVMALLFACSLKVYFYPIALVVLCYRAYLLALNLTVIFILFGLPGMVVSALIALPCQLAILALLLMFYFVLARKNPSFLGGGMKGKLRTSLVFLLLMLLLCSAESVLLVVCSASVMLVI